MALRDVTRDSILAALAEYDKLGAEGFREHYSFGPARTYYLVHDGKSYDSKAIAGAAHGFLPRQEASCRAYAAARENLLSSLHR
jgi:5-methylcytosine-specific restriction protein A